MPVDNGLLAEDLRRLAVRMRSDLAARTSVEPMAGQLREEYESAVALRATASTWGSWLDDRVSRTAAAWILATVLIRFCEDNDLLDIGLIEDGPAGDPVVDVVDRLCTHPALSAVFGGSVRTLWQLRPGREARVDLLAFWRRRTEDGTLVHDFTDSARDAAFLADLPVMLDENAMRSHGQVRTPGFVVEFIQDLVLEPALDDHGADLPGLLGFRFVDPACGTGEFLIGAYRRLMRRWSEFGPDMSSWQRAARSLRSVHGCDIDPCAVLVARFRLLMAALNDTGDKQRLDDVPDLQIVVASGDSLLSGCSGAGTFDADADGRSSLTGHRFLERGSYHAVTTNPPYVSVKDKALFAAYRDAYESCGGVYPLSVPFTELAFRLVVQGKSAGRAGLLTSNAFMKREFGRNLVECFLPTVEISHVIDTSGAYIPGHGTPTAILIGRGRVPDPATPVHVVVSLRGEPAMPEEPAEGLVWKALSALATGTGAHSAWAEASLQSRARLSVFPWTLTPTAALEVMRRMETGQRLKHRVARIGYAASTGSDDVFCAPADVLRRSGVEESATVPVLTGSEVRDWTTNPALLAFFPRSGPNLEPVELNRLQGYHRRLWPYRTMLRARPGAKKTAPWYDWHQIASDRGPHDWSVVFPWVATHPHFSLLRDRRVVPLNSAPEIRLEADASEESCFELLGALNSSAVSFWLKQMSQSKGQPRTDQLRGGEVWEKIYEFTSTRLLDLPLPRNLSAEKAERLDRLAAESQAILAEIANPDVGLTAAFLAEARSRWQALRSQLIAVQEELDWEMYVRYGLIADDGELTSSGSVPGIALGERSFEIVLARSTATGETDTLWFDRHASAPRTEIPEHWPSGYGDLVARRVEAIQENGLLELLERPEYKRRWATPGWDALLHDIVRDRLLGLCESTWLWYEPSASERRPAARSLRQLAELLSRSEDFLRLAEIHSPGSTITELLMGLLTDEHVPLAGPLRYKAAGIDKRLRWEKSWDAQRRDDEQGIAEKEVRHSHIVPPRYAPSDFLRLSYWRQRGKFDVPSERFVSFPLVTGPLSPATVLGWAGWSGPERALAVLDLLDVDSLTRRPEHALPLLSALAEALSQAAEPAGEPVRTPDRALLLGAFYDHVARLGLSVQEVREWRPPAPKRGRPRRDA
ncbi:BREX-2 system adenine-specific DNA-methyltransferase PglX [Streptomyces sp. NPDC004539]|uniref:BREX-2 system adenine-specific DNA-methyltransferase PglX n=1 Tax=Streptomyces sp. NPDC004539 TaxID=3154280 RepID=UPI0033AA9C6B